MPHLTREAFTAHQPVHVALRVADHVWNLRSERSFAVFDGALRQAQRRLGFRVVHFSVLGNHVHLVAEADGARALADGVRALTIRLARRLNVMMARRGPVFEDRYFAHVLRTPAEVRNALRYVLGNFASHAARRGEATRGGWVDPYSSAAVKAARHEQQSLFVEPATRPARTWLLRRALGRGGTEAKRTTISADSSSDPATRVARVLPPNAPATPHASEEDRATAVSPRDGPRRAVCPAAT